MLSGVAEPIAGGVAETSQAAQERAASLTGRTISDRYRILELLAMGGMGAVYRAEHLLMHKEVAIKILHPETENFPELVSRFEREAVAGAHIQHPNVATASDFGKFDEDSRFLVLEYIRGRTLRELIDDGPVKAERAAKIVRQAASALAAVHAMGIIHRDIKPRNIMILPGTRHGEDHVKLIDFGLAKVPVEQLSPQALDPDYGKQSLTAAGVVMGTVAYMAPEAAFGMRSVGHQADLYSLGVIFYEMLTGLHPFEATEPTLLFAQHRTKTPPPLRERNHTIDVLPAIEAIVMKLLAKEPETRHRDADELISAIDAALAPPMPMALGAPPGSRVPVAETSTASLVSDSLPAMRGGSRRWLAVALGLVLAGGGAVLFFRTGEPAPPPPTPSAASVTLPAAAQVEALPSPRPTTPPPVAPSARERLRLVVDAHDAPGAAALLLELGQKDPGVFKDRAVQADAAAAAELAAPGPQGDAAFEMLGSKLGSDGLDVLYDVVAREGQGADKQQVLGFAKPAEAGPRARAILGKPETLGRATPAMRVAYELRRASCTWRRNLFPRAGKEGDDRALAILGAMMPPGCSPQAQLCCLPKNNELERAIADIQARIRR